jgi:cell division protein FtsI/penicillin-binding protein 2
MNRKTGHKSQAGSIPPVVPVGLLAFGFVWVCANQLRVQMFGRGTILENAREVHRLFSSAEIPGRRGDIYSSDGRLLARSTDIYRLGINPVDVPESPALWSSVANVTGTSSAELLDFVSRRGRASDWNVTLTSEQANAINKIRAKYGADGIWVRSEGGREYSIGEFAAPLLGYVNADDVGMAGLERSQNKVLSGKTGFMTGIVDKTGSFLPWMTVAKDSRRPSDGSSVELTIDSDTQVAVMKSLQVQCEKHKAVHGTAIVMNPKTGDVLALATWPTYDPKRVAEAQQKMSVGETVSPQINPAIGLRFEPGSTFKVFTIALGLDTGIVSESDRITCTGATTFSGHVMHCASGHVHGSVDPEECIEKSCNVAAATWAVKMGFKRYADLITRLGLLKPQSVGLSPEVPGYLNFNDYSKIIQTANLGFGQSMNVTPLGLASAFTVFGNGGKRMMPRLIKSIDGVDTPLRTGNQVFKPETAERVRQMMQLVIQGPAGTATNLRIDGYTLAGKTGTAQKLGSGHGFVSSFVGYVPAEDPKALVLVMIDEPHAGGHYGAVVAGPVFKDTAMFLLKKYKILPDAAEANVAHP